MLRLTFVYFYPSNLKVNKGLTPGDAIAPLLFNIMLEIALEDLK
jgi:hypothetical protein